eukprot:scaffold7196_cov403-Prasinococcus_capsulatus_cf.AAC.5
MGEHNPAPSPPRRRPRGAYIRPGGRGRTYLYVRWRLEATFATVQLRTVRRSDAQLLLRRAKPLSSEQERWAGARKR